MMSLENKELSIKVGSNESYNDILDYLNKNNYENVNYINNVGEYSKRGEIIDIFSPIENNPVRIFFDFDKIDKAINIIRKTKNFQSFCKTKTDVTNYECTIFEFSYEILGSDIIFTISANRFLRNMVRSIIGTILEIGISKISLDSLNEIILKSNRIYAGPSIPAHGLFLTKVEYPKNIL